VSALHDVIARSIVLYFALLGVWGLVLAVRHAPLDASYRGALVIGGVLGVLQVVVGLGLLLMDARPRDNLHYLYGISILVTLPLVRQYLAGRRLSPPLAYGLGSLFMMGLAIRAITTG
jgi:hypothetical protein